MREREREVKRVIGVLSRKVVNLSRLLLLPSKGAPKIIDPLLDKRDMGLISSHELLLPMISEL